MVGTALVMVLNHLPMGSSSPGSSSHASDPRLAPSKADLEGAGSKEAAPSGSPATTPSVMTALHILGGSFDAASFFVVVFILGWCTGVSPTLLSTCRHSIGSLHLDIHLSPLDWLAASRYPLVATRLVRCISISTCCHSVGSLHLDIHLSPLDRLAASRSCGHSAAEGCSRRLSGAVVGVDMMQL
eukprot:1193340-Prorocentrum_minimum.AAC.3